jgi:predicted GH43/DUF377 family glycosyl hydrolase
MIRFALMRLRRKSATFAVAIVAGGASLLGQHAWEIGAFRRPASGNPVIEPRPESVFQCPVRKAPVHWEALHTFNPAATVRDGKIYVLYRAEDDSGEMAIGGHTSRIGLAESADGVHFTRRSEPVLYPDEDDQKAREWPGGCEDPRIVEAPDGSYVMTYTQWNRKTYDAGIATSTDLVHWVKHGPMLAKAAGGKYQDLQYKSAAIVTQLRGGRLMAAKIDGTYWMFWGEGNVHLARSANLIDWTPVENASGDLLDVLGPRDGKFDSSFPEAGPPPVLTDRGIVVLYNGKNSSDPALAKDAYAVGQALFRGYDPKQLLSRLDKPFFFPEMPFEKSGQYAAGTTFAEGLVRFHNRWILYYGCADSLVGVALTQ